MPSSLSHANLGIGNMLTLKLTCIQVVCMSDTSMQPAAERVYELVKERIIDGTIDSSRMLSEAALAAEVGVSRTPAHEAFLRLELEGFLQLYPKRGALVVPISP